MMNDFLGWRIYCTDTNDFEPLFKVSQIDGKSASLKITNEKWEVIDGYLLIKYMLINGQSNQT